MATAPVKSQPLHNFDLPHLRWAHKNHHSSHSNTHHRFRRRESPDLHQSNNIPSSSPSRAADSDPDHDDTCGQVSKPSSRTPRKPFSFSSCSSQQNHQQKDAAAGSEKEKEKDDGLEEGESEAKPWNLRPRKVVNFPTASFKKGEKMPDETVLYQKNDNSGGSYGLPKSSRLRGPVVEGSGPGMAHGPSYGSERQRKVVEEKKRKLWISLSREEIEEDVYALTGSRPARRPKKRPKTVQKQLDNVFPGMYLVGMTVDYCRLHDSLMSGLITGLDLVLCRGSSVRPDDAELFILWKRFARIQKEMEVGNVEFVLMLWLEASRLCLGAGSCLLLVSNLNTIQDY